MNIAGDARSGTRDRRSGSYSPGRRTALVLGGTGAHGAYHAGVLRAVQEAGVKIDLVAGHGIGAGGAVLAAIDGGARLWEADGIWRSPRAQTLYTWKRPLRVAAWMTLLLIVVLLVPVLVLASGLIVYPIGFALTLVGLGAGTAVTDAFSEWLQVMFSPDYLPTVVPRLAMVALAALAGVLAAGVAVARWRTPPRRRSASAWWWQIFGAPFDAAPARAAFSEVIWGLIRGAGVPQAPAADVIGRRYGEVLGESIGQPGFRELIAIATDLDARRDVVVVLLREPHRREYLAPPGGRDRRGEVLDLAGIGRDHAIDVITAALTPPVVCDPALVTFSIDSLWRGETHRLCDRPAAISRLLEEVAAAGVSQIVVVSAVAPTHEPHRLHAPRLDLRHRLGDFLAAAECAALRDALQMARLRFDSVYVVCPDHNPLGAFDLQGVHDDASDRRQDLTELLQRGYEDAYRQFIEPIVGGSGEHLDTSVRT